MRLGSMTSDLLCFDSPLDNMLDEMRDVVRWFELSRPRSLQTSIGPSDAGTPCARRLAYKMLDVEKVNTATDPWAAIIGTSVHAWLDKAFSEANAHAWQPRWEVSTKIDIPGYMTGTIDLFDHATGTVIDHKVIGATAMAKVKKGITSEQYRTQGHLYGLGLIAAGFDVKHVAICYWSRTGALKDAQYWTEPYDEAIAEAALQRIDALKIITANGVDSLAEIPTADGFCLYCPYFSPANTDIAQACPGHVIPKVSAQPAPDAITN